jgi:hypothetical protein
MRMAISFDSTLSMVTDFSGFSVHPLLLLRLYVSSRRQK